MSTTPLMFTSASHPPILNSVLQEHRSGLFIHRCPNVQLYESHISPWTTRGWRKRGLALDRSHAIRYLPCTTWQPHVITGGTSWEKRYIRQVSQSMRYSLGDGNRQIS